MYRRFRGLTDGQRTVRKRWLSGRSRQSRRGGKGALSTMALGRLSSAPMPSRARGFCGHSLVSRRLSASMPERRQPTRRVGKSRGKSVTAGIGPGFPLCVNIVMAVVSEWSPVEGARVRMPEMRLICVTEAVTWMSSGNWPTSRRRRWLSDSVKAVSHWPVCHALSDSWAEQNRRRTRNS